MTRPAPAYCPYYCEENVWQLCAHPSVAAHERRVLLISNPGRRVAMWGQAVAKDPTLPIAWDYHVILLARAPEADAAWQAWDLDSATPQLLPARAWLEASFHSVGLLPPQFEPRFRLVSCADYRRHLRSDRRHMRGPDGAPKAPPPDWPEIRGEPVPGFPDEGSNLERFLDTEDPEFLGELVSLAELRAWLRADC